MKPRLLFPLAFLCAAVLGNPEPARAQCDNPKTNEQRAQCIGAELRGADATINRVYSDLMKSLSPDDHTALRDEQRAWIKARDKKCGLTWSKGDREAWFADLLKDYQKTVCVVRLTNERVDALNRYQKANHVDAPPAASNAGTDPASSAANDDAEYELISPASRRKGKWYFEVRLDPRAILKVSEVSLFVGVQQSGVETGAINAEGESVGQLLPIRRKYKDADLTIFGFALDADNGKLYTSRNGVWEGGEPGSAGGNDLIRGRAYETVLNSSVALDGFKPTHAIDINLGERDFSYHLPNGYLPFSAK
jgi:uncharacterized protein YecT (DUF1311 family)